jgi:hypothetical protein
MKDYELSVPELIERLRALGLPAELQTVQQIIKEYAAGRYARLEQRRRADGVAEAGGCPGCRLVTDPATATPPDTTTKQEAPDAAV